MSTVYQIEGINDKSVAVGLDEAAEFGLAKEVISDELYFPAHPSRDWVRSYVVNPEAGHFFMYLEGEKRVRFLLSAKQVTSGCFLISTHEAFPQLVDPAPKEGYLGRLEQQHDRSFLLSLKFCHLCDQKFGYFTCGRGKNEREVLAKIVLNSRRYSITGTSHRIEYRTIDVALPSISKSGKRKVWCPRAFRASNPSFTVDTDVHSALQQDKKMSQHFTSKTPEWNPDVQTLVVKFYGDRVLLPSTKNMLLMPADSKELYVKSDSSSRGGSYAGSSGHHGDNYMNSPAMSPHLTPHSPKKLLRAASHNLSNYSLPSVQGGDMMSVLSDKSIVKTSKRAGSPMPPAPNSPRSREIEGERALSIESTHTDSYTNSNSNSPVPKRREEGRSSSRKEKDKDKDSEKSSKDKDKDIVKDRDKEKDKERRSRRKVENDQALDPETIEIHNRAALQFGKTSHTKYSLDFKYPLSPIQAFGIALASFGAERSPSSASSVVSDYSGSTDTSSR